MTARQVHVYTGCWISSGSNFYILFNSFLHLQHTKSKKKRHFTPKNPKNPKTNLCLKLNRHINKLELQLLYKKKNTAENPVL